MDTETLVPILLLAFVCKPQLTLAIKDCAFKGLQGCMENYAMSSNVVASLESRSKLDCAKSCSLDGRCLGYNLCKTGSPASPVPFLCQLVSKWSQNSCDLLSSAPGCSFWQMDIPCVHGSVNTTARKCVCQTGYAGVACERLIRAPSTPSNVFLLASDCKEGKEMGMTGYNNDVLIQPLGAPSPFVTRCNFMYGFTTLVYRYSGCASTDPLMVSSWQDLQVKQGSCRDCCFVGLDNVFYLLNQGLSYILTVYMQYESFSKSAKVWYPNARMAKLSDGSLLTLGPAYTLPNQVPPAGDGFLSEGKFCSPDHDCSGCASAAGHAGWFYDNVSACSEALGLGDPLLWTIGGVITKLDLIMVEVERF